MRTAWDRRRKGATSSENNPPWELWVQGARLPYTVQKHLNGPSLRMLSMSAVSRGSARSTLREQEEACRKSCPQGADSNTTQPSQGSQCRKSSAHFRAHWLWEEQLRGLSAPGMWMCTLAGKASLLSGPRSQLGCVKAHRGVTLHPK